MADLQQVMLVALPQPLAPEDQTLGIGTSLAGLAHAAWSRPSEATSSADSVTTPPSSWSNGTPSTLLSRRPTRKETVMPPDPRTPPSGRAAPCRLLLVRHAKAVPKSRPVEDFERPLSRRGRADAPRPGRRLADSGLMCDLVLCSPARRTRQTWQLAVPALDEPPPVVYDERLYNAPPSMLVEVLAERGRGLSCLALVGHNPGIHQLAAGLCGAGPRDLLKRVRAGFPTAGVVVVDVPGGWEAVSPGSGTIAAFWSPAD
ncbi:SixA phosphatase family protein [Streptomyces zaomyceticus]|uniref:SixA phosphatase family protein n=1 Tax=Streptomyces zaomyceticus TaxID=68286 RepID=UPI003446623D